MAAEKWAATASGLVLGSNVFVAVEYPTPHGLVRVIVKVKPRVTYDCEYVDDDLYRVGGV
jgi:hypothetical protein